MKESVFQSKVIQYLKSLENTYVVKVWGGGYQRAGIPDILACINGHFVALELKNEVGKPSKLQEYNIKQIQAANGIALILRPDDFEGFKKDLVKLYA